MKPLCIDLFCGLGGWTEGFMAEGWECIGFDIERHSYGGQKYPAQLVLQDVLTIHGSQFKSADCIVASPPCQQYSWLAMPWSRSKDPNNSKAAKALRAKWETEGPDNRLFDACFRIQREAIEAAGRFIPLIVENVRGANEWVTPKSTYNHRSFYLWGDVPVIMPFSMGRKSRTGGGWFGDASGNATRKNDPRDVRKMPDGKWETPDGTKIGGDWFRDPACHSAHGSRSQARKAASAQIAKIPLALSSHIASVYYPKKAMETQKYTTQHKSVDMQSVAC